MIAENLLEEMRGSEEFFETALILTLLYYVLLTIAQWKLFTKAGEKGWKALIPFYSMFVSHHLIGMRHIWFILDIIFWAIEVILELINGTPMWLERTFLPLRSSLRSCRKSSISPNCATAIPKASCSGSVCLYALPCSR